MFCLVLFFAVQEDLLKTIMLESVCFMISRFE